MLEKTQLYVQEWLELPLMLRIQMADLFQIPKSGGSHVVSGEVLSDGHTNEDLKALTLDKMHSFTGDESDDFLHLLKLTIDKVYGKDKTSEANEGADSSSDESTAAAEEEIEEQGGDL